MSLLPILISYNHPEHTESAVRSILQHDEYNENAHKCPLVLIHNGSEKKHIEQLRRTFPQIDHYELQQNKGYTGGANAGINYAIQKYNENAIWILFLTNDCLLESWPDMNQVSNPAFLAPWVSMRKSEKIDSIGGRLNLITGKPSHLKRNIDFHALLQNKSHPNELPYIPGSAFLIHNSIFSALKGFDESLHTYWEDIDFSIRAHKSQFTLGELSSFKVRHKIGKTCHKDSHYTTYLYQRNRHRVCRKYSQGIYSRCLLEFYLWTSWIHLGFKLLLKNRTKDFKKLIKGILDLPINC